MKRLGLVTIGLLYLILVYATPVSSTQFTSPLQSPLPSPLERPTPVVIRPTVQAETGTTPLSIRPDLVPTIEQQYSVPQSQSAQPTVAVIVNGSKLINMRQTR